MDVFTTKKRRGRPPKEMDPLDEEESLIIGVVKREPVEQHNVEFDDDERDISPPPPSKSPDSSVRRSSRPQKRKTYGEGDDGTDEDYKPETQETEKIIENSEYKPKKKRGRKRMEDKEKEKKCKGLPHLSHGDQTTREVKSAVFDSFVTGDTGPLISFTYKDVELKREKNTKGYTIKSNMLQKFRKEVDGKYMYHCEDCNFSVQYKSAFKIHFIAHANISHIVKIINSTLKAHFCHICDIRFPNVSDLTTHLNEHKIVKDEDGTPPETNGDDIPNVNSVEIFIKENYEPEPSENVPAQKNNQIKETSRPPLENEEEKVYMEVQDDYDDNDNDGFNNDAADDSEDDVKPNIGVLTEHQIKIEKVSIPTSDDDDEDDNKPIVVIKKELCTANESEDLLQNTGYIKLEKELPMEFKPTKKENNVKVKCEKCQYEADAESIHKHNCDEVRQCDMCDKVLSCNRVFRYHRKFHFCGKCNFKSVSTDEVMEHRKNSPDCWSNCDNCDFKTTNSDSYVRHLRSRTCFKDKNIKLERAPEDLYCELCSYKTRYKVFLEKHMSGHKVNSKYKGVFSCSICQTDCYSQQVLIMHQKRHYCDKCTFMSDSTKQVLEHKKLNPECQYKCKDCNYSSPHTASVARHIKSQCNKGISDSEEKPEGPIKIKKNLGPKMYHCDECNYRTNSKKYLEAHVFKHSDPKPFHCDQCDYKCAQKGNLMSHQKKHIDGKSYCCSVCDFQTSFLSKFTSHKKAHGMSVPESKIEADKTRDPNFLYCDKCEFRSKYPQYFKNHQMRHGNVRPYLCPYCGDTFFSSVDYHVHKNNAHRPRKSYKCSYCDYSYTNKNTVLIHERKHTGAKPHACEFCSYSTSYAGNLRAHRKKHLATNATPTYSHSES